MDIRPLTDSYAVSPQISPEDVPEIAARGYEVVICNRPDAEVPVELQAGAIQAAVEAAGLRFVLNPVIGGALSMENVTAQREALDGGGNAGGTTTENANGARVLAYCASGNRSSIIWALANAGRVPTDDLIAAGAQYGYQTAQFRDLIEKLAQERG